MKTILFASPLLALALFACAAPTDEESQDSTEKAAVENTGEVSSKMINEGGCTPEQIAMGGYDDGYGECITGGGGGGGGGGSNPTGCFTRCDTAEGKCEAKCKTNVCITNCLKVMSRCESFCY